MSILSIQAPTTAEKTTISTIEANTSLAFDFAPEEAVFSRSGNSLTISFDNNGVIEVVDFFAPAEGVSLPVLVLSDGTSVNSADFLAAMNPDLDVTPAAAAAQTGSGIGDYSDNAGELVNGLTGSDSLGNIQWSSELGVSGLEIAAGYNIAGSDSAPTDPLIPPVNPPVDPPVEPPVADDAYHTRLIINFSQDGEARIKIFDENGNIITDPSAVESLHLGDPTYFNEPSIDPVTGELIITLTAEGLAALEQGVQFENIIYVTINGQEYPVHLLGLANSGEYDVAANQPSPDLPGPLYAEHYSHQSENMFGNNINLGGEKYNQVDINVSREHGSASGTGNSNISLQNGVEGQINISAESADSSAYAVRVNSLDGDTTSSIKAGSQGDININASSGGTNAAMGIVTQSQTDANGNALYKSTADISGRNIDITTTAQEKTAAGIWAGEKSEVTVNAEGNLSFSSTVTGGTVNFSSVGAYASKGSTVNISGQNVSAESYAYKGNGEHGVVKSAGFSTAPGGTMNINTADDGTFSVSSYQESSPYSSPYSGIHWTGGKAAGFTSIGLSAEGSLPQFGENGLRSAINVNAGDVDIQATVDHASSKGPAVGVYSGYGGNVTINTSDLDNNVVIRGDAPSWGVGVYSTNRGTTTINTGKGDDTVFIGASAHNGAAAIGIGAQANGKTIIDGGEGYDIINIDTKFTGTTTLSTDYMEGANAGAMGMNSAWDGASNIISGFEHITITADASGSENGWAYGMFTVTDWKMNLENVIQNTDSPLTVIITAIAGTNGQAYAMYGKGGGHNLIQGGSQSGDLHGDSISLTGNIGGGSLNEVKTGAGNDHIEINGSLTGGTNNFSMGNGEDRFDLTGNITGGSNTINMGAGDDIITLDGSVTGNVQILGGDGYDMLVLKAESFQDFFDKYDSWLKGNISNIQVENIHVNINGLSADDQALLESYLEDSHFADYNIDYSAGASIAAATSLASFALDLPDILSSSENELDLLTNNGEQETDRQDVNALDSPAPSITTEADNVVIYANNASTNSSDENIFLLQQEIIIGAGG